MELPSMDNVVKEFLIGFLEGQLQPKYRCSAIDIFHHFFDYVKFNTKIDERHKRKYISRAKLGCSLGKIDGVSKTKNGLTFYKFDVAKIKSNFS